MANKSGDIGTRTEGAVVRVLKDFWPNAERRRLKGSGDQGDIITVPDLVWSVKGGKAAERASDNQIEEWLDELDGQVANANARIGILVVKRKGVGYANAHRWWAIRRDRLFRERPSAIRRYLIDECRFLRRMGF